METKADRKQRIARHRARGRGRKAFWVVVAGAVLVAGLGLVRGFGSDRAASPQGRDLATLASPEQLVDRIDRLLDHLDATDAQRATIEALVDELTPEQRAKLIELWSRR